MINKLAFFSVSLLALVACSANKSARQSNIKLSKAPSLTDNERQAFANGTDFIAIGTDGSSWRLEVTSNDTVYFNSNDGASFSILAQRTTPSDRSILFSAKKDPFKVDVQIGDEYCSNGLLETKVSINEKTYTGCGKFLYNNELNGSWTLEKIGSKSYTAKDFKRKLPTVDFNIHKKSIKGNDGCNNFFGAFQLRGKQIKFYEFAYTKKKCGSTDFSGKTLKYINNKIVSYAIKDGTLILYLYDDSRMVFKRSH